MYKEIKDKAGEAFQSALHRYIKFGVECSIGVLHTKNEHNFHALDKFIRPTDSLVQVDINTFVIFYNYTEIDDAKYAFINLIKRMDEEIEDLIVGYTKIYEEDKGIEEIISRLTTIFLDAKESDEDILNDEKYMKEFHEGKIDFTDIITD